MLFQNNVKNATYEELSVELNKKLIDKKIPHFTYNEIIIE